MPGRLPGVQAREILKALEKAGFTVVRQKGSHVTLRNDATARTTVVPVHSSELPRWLLKKIIKDAGRTDEQFRELL